MYIEGFILVHDNYWHYGLYHSNRLQSIVLVSIHSCIIPAEGPGSFNNGIKGCEAVFNKKQILYDLILPESNLRRPVRARSRRRRNRTAPTFTPPSWRSWMVSATSLSPPPTISYGSSTRETPRTRCSGNEDECIENFGGILEPDYAMASTWGVYGAGSKIGRAHV